MRAYALQTRASTPSTANTTPRFDDDERHYGIAARMLQREAWAATSII